MSCTWLLRTSITAKPKHEVHGQTESVNLPAVGRRFHKTILNEFYQVAFRKKIYNTLEELQNDADLWTQSYNEERPYSGRYCDGKTPMETFLQSKQDKMLGRDLAA